MMQKIGHYTKGAGDRRRKHELGSGAQLGIRRAIEEHARVRRIATMLGLFDKGSVNAQKIRQDTHAARVSLAARSDLSGPTTLCIDRRKTLNSYAARMAAARW